VHSLANRCGKWEVVTRAVESRAAMAMCVYGVWCVWVWVWVGAGGRGFVFLHKGAMSESSMILEGSHRRNFEKWCDTVHSNTHTPKGGDIGIIGPVSSVSRNPLV